MTPHAIFANLTTGGPGAYAVAADQTILFWNDGAERILGHSADQVTGLRCHQVAARGLTNDCRCGCPSMRQLRNGQIPTATEMQILSASGERKTVGVIPVVIAGVLDGEPMLVHLLEDPAATGFVVGDAEGERDVARSAEVVINPNRSARGDAVNVPALSPREVQVLRLVALGKETARIAEELGVSRHTAQNHIRNFRQKLGAATKLDAVVAAIHLGIIRVD